ncbi:MAG: serine hydrolase domain-containing protein [Chloroflexota bacterium]
MTALQSLIEREAQKANTHSVLLGVQSADASIDFQGGAGDAQPDSPYFIASVSKMVTAAVVMGLVDEGMIDLNAPLSAYLPSELLSGLHVHQGTDYSPQLKLYHLVNQTSGIADYFEGRIADDLWHNHDRAYSAADVVNITRERTPAAAPESGKAHYSDTNYQLLGAVIEGVTGQSLADVFRAWIFIPLGLTNTYLYDCKQRDDALPLPLYHQAQRLDLPLALTSERGAGGVVSTLADNLRFLRAFFDGELFDRDHLSRMQSWNPLFFPMDYGYGLMRFKLPRAMTLFRYSPELIGHSGSSGSFAFYAPRERLYIAGTFNQFDKPSRPFQFMLKVIAAAQSA